MPTDTETGYRDEVECECTPCAKCNGEGVATDENGIQSDDPCEACQGTGKDSGDCAVHADIDGNPRATCCRLFEGSGIHSKECGNAPLKDLR